MEFYLVHHGILGQKWGIRRYQNPDGSWTTEGLARLRNNNLKNAKTANLDTWGNSPDNNILYITGYSGSGKSTTAIGMAKSGDIVIHLDGYAENNNRNICDKSFNTYLDSRLPKWKDIGDATKNGTNGSIKRFSKSYWNLVDSFNKALKDYAKDQYGKGHRVIVEGVQIADNWLEANKEYYSNKPIIILGTNALSSSRRAFERDERSFKSLSDIKEYVSWLMSTNLNLSELERKTNAKKGEEWINKTLKGGAYG